MARVYGFGIIGTGVIFESHADAISRLPERARLIGVSDIDEDKLRQATARHFAPYAYADHRRMLERDDIDIVIVATPPATHERLVLEALEAGKHVICEKPLAHTLAAADRIIAAAAEFPYKLAVVYQQRYLPEVKKVIWLRDGGWLGDLLFGTWTRVDRFAGSTWGAAGWWGRWQVAGGGVVMTQFIHELDLMTHVFGRPVDVYAVMDTLQRDIESEDTFAATVRFENGAIVTCSSTVNAHRFAKTFDIVGGLASVHLPWAARASDPEHQRRMTDALNTAFPIRKPPSRSLHARAFRKGLRALRLAPRTGHATPNYHAAYTAAFLDALDSNDGVPVSPAEARVSLALCTAIYGSALSGSPVSLPLDDSSLCYEGIKHDAYRDRAAAGIS